MSAAQVFSDVVPFASGLLLLVAQSRLDGQWKKKLNPSGDESKMPADVEWVAEVAAFPAAAVLTLVGVVLLWDSRASGSAMIVGVTISALVGVLLIWLAYTGEIDRMNPSHQPGVFRVPELLRRMFSSRYRGKVTETIPPALARLRVTWLLVALNLIGIGLVFLLPKHPGRG